MANSYIERRKYLRYDTDMKVYFQVKYDIKTRVEFIVLEEEWKSGTVHKYSGLCKNVNVEGMCFVSRKKLNKGDILLLDVYEPIVKGPVRMEGEVRWSKKISGKEGDRGLFRTGVRLISVNGKSVADSIYFDKKYKIVWSAVLESLFGNFAAMLKKLKKRRKS
ncbi:MAG: PilZ domain-containing protein [Candidatus Omnitrophica bacterium]|nr:PilZ domain-containing protein [Candidatus Omnitrophota bacterium]